MGFPGGAGVKNLPAMKKTQVQSLGREDPVEKEMATHSSNLSWEIWWTEEPGGLQSMGSQKSWTQLSGSTATANHTHGRKKMTCYQQGTSMWYIIHDKDENLRSENDSSSSSKRRYKTYKSHYHNQESFNQSFIPRVPNIQHISFLGVSNQK